MTQLLDAASIPTSKSELDFFSVPVTQVGVKDGGWIDVYPTNAVTDVGPYEFHIPPEPHFLDLNKNYLYVQLYIAKADDTNLTVAAPGQPGDPDAEPPIPAVPGVPASDVAPINLIGKTFFKQVKLFLQSKLVYDSGDSYAYRAMMETQLNHDQNVKVTLTEVAGYYLQEAGKHDNPENDGYKRRKKLFGGSTRVEFMAPLHIDLCHQQKLLLNKMDVRLELHRNRDEFCLMSFENNPAYKVRVEKMYWKVRKVTVADTATLALEKALLKVSAKYPIRRVQVKTMQLDQATQDLPSNVLFNGQIPRRVIITLVANDAFHGHWKKSPFKFHHYTVTSAQITAGGVSYPPNPLKMDFNTDRYIEAYVQLYEVLGIAGTHRSIFLDYNDFGDGEAYFAFDLSPDVGDGGNWELVREGTTQIHMTFRDPIPAGGAKLIAFAEFDNLLMVDRWRNVYYDYTP